VLRRVGPVVLALGVASALCLALLEVRTDRTGSSFYGFLGWNLFLAWVPFVLALLAYARSRLDVAGAALLVLWLLFFPNAPYVLTDFIHLGESTAAPVWYDALMLSAFAWTSLVLGYASLFLVQVVVRRSAGDAWSWLAVAVSLALASFGMYLGRFVRFNSWDALVRPGRVLDVVRTQLENPVQHPRLVAVLFTLTAFLLVGYAVVYAFAALMAPPERT
jgi:uncharacterized membrane protein